MAYDYEVADAIRETLDKMGVVVMDRTFVLHGTDEGSEWDIARK